LDRKVSIITDPDGRKIVLINDVRFKSRRSIKWADIERYLKEYIGKCYEISETAEKIYIGSDFPAYNEKEELVSYTIFVTRMLVRCDEKGKLFLYDFVRTKKETSKPHD